MAIFADGVAYQTNTVTTAAHLVFTGNSTGLAALSPAVTLKDITIVNTGAVNIFLGSSSVTAATGLILRPGNQVTIQGWTETSGTTTYDVYGITSSGTTTTEAALATVVAVS